VGAREIRQPRDNHTGVGDRLLKRCEMDAWIAGRVMGQGRQRVAIGLRNVLSRDSASCSGTPHVQGHRAVDYHPSQRGTTRPFGTDRPHDSPPSSQGASSTCVERAMGTPTRRGSLQ
jgi:hypothetical protein